MPICVFLFVMSFRCQVNVVKFVNIDGMSSYVKILIFCGYTYFDAIEDKSFLTKDNLNIWNKCQF